MKRPICLFALIAATFAQPFPDARATDPNTLGWMQGAPPPRDKIIRYDDQSFFRFPQTRWTFSNWNQIFPANRIERAGAVSPLPRALRADLEGVRFTPLNGTHEMTWRESLDANYTDGIVVLQRGRIVYEYYTGALNEHRRHIAFSVTKSFFGVLYGMLVAEGKLDPSAPVAKYIPELKNSGFADATLDQVADMTSGLNYTEDYADPKSNWPREECRSEFVVVPVRF